MQREIRLFLILLCSLCLFVPHTSATNQTKLKRFKNERDDISIGYPEGWFVREEKYRNPYAIFLSREKIEKAEDVFKAGISIFKFYHQSWYFGLDINDIDKSLNFCMDNYNNTIPFSNKKITGRKSVLIDGDKGVMEEVSFDAPGDYRVKTYMVYVMKDDILVNLVLEAPESEFESYRQAFEESIKTARLFSPEGKLADNVLLDREIDQMLIVDTKLGDAAGDMMKIASVFNNAIAMSPLYAKARFLYGSFLMSCAKAMTGEEQSKILGGAEEQFRLAIELYNKYPQDYNEQERNLNISQCYYLLGDIYYFPYDNKEEAKPLYEESLKFFEHGGARKALEEYFKE